MFTSSTLSYPVACRALLKFNLVLLDLGFSSNQLEDAQIGISFKADSKLNMNYLNSDFTAYDIVNNYSEEELSRVFADYGEIKQSLKLAKFIVRTRQGKSINTNFDLIEVLRGSGVNFRSKKNKLMEIVLTYVILGLIVYFWETRR